MELKGKTMTVDTTTAGMLIAERLEHTTECAHVTFPEVTEVEWMPSLLVGMLEQLAELAQSGAPLDILGNAVEHAFIVAAAAGMAAGRVIATEELLDARDDFEALSVVSLDNVDWDNLPDFDDSDVPEEEE